MGPNDGQMNPRLRRTCQVLEGVPNETLLWDMYQVAENHMSDDKPYLAEQEQHWWFVHSVKYQIYGREVLQFMCC